MKRVMPRYFLDIRSGCGAVRDKWHESYDEDYPGLHSDTPDVVEYKHGILSEGCWNMKSEDVKYLNDFCELLNSEMAKKMSFLTIDPPGGWKFGFPKSVTEEQYKEIKDLKKWCISNGYPKSEADSYGEYFHVRIYKSSIEKDN